MKLCIRMEAYIDIFMSIFTACHIPYWLLHVVQDSMRSKIIEAILLGSSKHLNLLLDRTPYQALLNIQ